MVAVLSLLAMLLMTESQRDGLRQVKDFARVQDLYVK